ncbi:MAG: UvrD-helicase domain-containing protein [Bacilli bacterium]|nr:UvrD-helicase domain-containing protein [Bacilli bacterium]
MNWTEEQLQAITESGKNIIVSAGAGSGKTAVLTERVLKKLEQGININELLILTFTNAAANSMKKKIRKKIYKYKDLNKQKELLDGSYICTFDSFSLSIVKKYHTYLNVSNNIKVTDNVIIEIEKRKILDKIFEEKYQNPTDKFMKLIDSFCLKDDKDLKDNILKVYSKIELKSDKKKYLEEYLSSYFNDKKINLFIEDYLNEINKHINNLKYLYNEALSIFESKYIDSLIDVSKLIESTTYEDIKSRCHITLKRLQKSTPEEKSNKQAMKNELDELEKLCIYKDTNEMKNEILSTKDNIEEIVNILVLLDEELSNYKSINEIYNFNDIAHLAIKVVRDNTEVQEELTNSFKEILIDEYQDTSDLQEEFINLISNNNVYMVGDIKQSIYRFRNANPYLFKSKYDDYSKGHNGLKIDLLKNFRSRSEVLNSINNIFDKIMNNNIGGADYKSTHKMIFGNNSYNEEGKTKENYDLDILTYELNDKKITKEEEEAFIIANDIKNKVESKYQIFDKDNKVFHDANYSDFVILMDKSTNFDLYKEIFTYLEIPLSIEKEEDLGKDYDLLVIKNLLNLIIHIKENNLDKDFIYSYISIARSYLFRMNDNDIYNIYISNSYKDTELYKKCLELTNYIDTMNPIEYYDYILNEFSYDTKLITIGNINNYIVKKEYIHNLLEDYQKTGNTIYNFTEYLNEIYDNEFDIKFKPNKSNTNSVKIMTIHASKGLEYPVCYYSGLYSKFNLSDIKDRIFYDNKYGIIIPSINDFYKDTITRTLSKKLTTKEEISERIRLLYVALTRAEEKMIIVMPEEEEVYYDEIPDYIKEKYYSFSSIMKSILSNFSKEIEKREVQVDKNYHKNKERNTKNLILPSDNLKVNELSLEKELVEEKHFSKENIHEVNKEEKEVLEFGTKVHEVLEYLDFKNDNIDDYDISDNIKSKIKAFLNTDLIKANINNTMYKEYEFIDEDNNTDLHGIIDLLIEGKDKYIIVDYKLKNIDDSHYDDQLNGYRKYIKSKTDKEVECYLYSIIDEKYRKVEAK